MRLRRNDVFKQSVSSKYMNFEWITSIDDIEMLRYSQSFHDKRNTIRDVMQRSFCEYGKGRNDEEMRRKYLLTFVQLHPERASAIMKSLSLEGEHLIENIFRDGCETMLAQLLVRNYDPEDTSMPCRHVFVNFSLLDLPENNPTEE